MSLPASSVFPSPRLLGKAADNNYLTYPHANGFTANGRHLVTGRIEARGHSLWRHDLFTGDEVRIGCLPADFSGDPLWFDVARDTGRLVAVANNEVWLFDATGLLEPVLVYRENNDGGVLHSLSSISADGTRLIIGRRIGDRHEALELTPGSGAVRVLFSMPWFANHFHLSPYDETWIGFSHEGAADLVTDRVWAWHERLAPAGLCLLDQRPQGLWLGHERWSFHTTSAFAVCYGGSPGGPRGIYELFPDGRPPRLISEGDRDWHVNISQNGRWAVVDTTGPHDQPGRGWANAGDASDIMLIEISTGHRTPIARSRRAAKHPFHPHPTFSPDGERIFYNEAGPDGVSCKIQWVPNPTNPNTY